MSTTTSSVSPHPAAPSTDAEVVPRDRAQVASAPPIHDEALTALGAA